MTALDLTHAVGRVRARIASAGDPAGVRIVAVTKGFGPEAVDAAMAAGLDDIGESYAQEILAKAPQVTAGRPTWHFVGRLQTNKVRQLAGLVDVWQAVDRITLGDELARRAPGARILVQVNVSDEPQKGGCAPREVASMVSRCRHGGLDVVGLMAVGAAGPPETARPGFRLLRRLADDSGLAECSMGMSADLEVAVEEGATIVRVGRALFGERPRPGGGDPPH